MDDDAYAHRWLYVGVASLTCAGLVLELTFTRLFSVVMYYHFAFLAISLAMSGFGFAGVIVYLRPRLTDPERLHRFSRRR